MCGLLAAYDPGGVALAPLLAGLGDLRHRWPDASRHGVAEEGRLFLGHTRLKIIDLSDDANQPMLSPDGRYALIFNGEIYNYRALRAEIGGAWAWRTQSDSEVLLALFARDGAACLHRLNGMFAFAIYDRERHCLFLARDRFGIKPLYSVEIGRTMAFASEIPPLLRLLPSVVEDRRAIRTYLETGAYDCGPLTFFRDVQSIEAGCWMEIGLAKGEKRTERWYEFARNIPDLSGMDEAELVEETESRVRQAIVDHLVSDVPVGLNVSGGVDSSFLVRVAVESLGEAHLFCQDYAAPYSEAAWVREVAAGGRLHVSDLSWRDIDGDLAATVRSQAEPFGGVTVCGYNAIYRRADENGVIVLLDGNGADEVFLGYKRHHQIYVREAAGTAEEASRRAAYEEFWREPAPRAGPTGASIDGTVPVRPAAIAPELLESVEALPRPASMGFDDPVRDAAADDLLRSKIPRGLRFNDRVSMAHSKELRVPYLDHRLVEFGFGVPVGMLLNGSGTKAVFRKAAARRMPAHVAFAAKRSVQTPQREWLANEWQPRVRSILASNSFAARGWIDAGAALDIYEDYLAGARENSFFIWQWLNLELWAREFLDGGRNSA